MITRNILLFLYSLNFSDIILFLIESSILKYLKALVVIYCKKYLQLDLTFINIIDNIIVKITITLN